MKLLHPLLLMSVFSASLHPSSATQSDYQRSNHRNSIRSSPRLTSFPNPRSPAHHQHHQSPPAEGSVRLTGGQRASEGNVEIYHMSRWGSVCDDEFDQSEGDVVCRSLGYTLGADRVTSSGFFGPGLKIMWMDNLYCRGNEHELHHCPFDGWRIHDCQANEVAGVVCKERIFFSLASGSSAHPVLPSIRSSVRTRTTTTTSTTTATTRLVMTAGTILAPAAEGYDDSHANQVINSPAVPPQPELPALTHRLPPPQPPHPPLLLSSSSHHPSHGADARLVSHPGLHGGGGGGVVGSSGVRRQPVLQSPGRGGGYARISVSPPSTSSPPTTTATTTTTTTARTTSRPSFSSASPLNPDDVLHLNSSYFLPESETAVRLPVDHESHENQVELRRPEDYFAVRLNGGRNRFEGRIEIETRDGRWLPVCGDGFDLRTGSAVCQHLSFGWAYHAFATISPLDESLSFNASGLNESIIRLECDRRNSLLSDCRRREVRVRDCSPKQENWATVICTHYLPDLVPDAAELESSVVVEDRQMVMLQCASEENCLSSSSLQIDRNNYDWLFESRRLLRFTAKIRNAGTADFRPLVHKSSWVWHSCHKHYHSMETFAHFDILSPASGVRVAEGHKASFCLEDNDCDAGVSGKYKCANYGDQGISPGCKDIYLSKLDCQWIDITDLDAGRYVLRMTINPEMKVAESSFDNNAVSCSLLYDLTSVRVTNCSLAPIY